ncbi:hypothetical protein [uncultured Metabacillus sp.]|uniref:hypothetical protein n=1 Tax=uncultured Metabacillus sp. TaxID=2860135 RepID=UPI00260A0397|nr:hypothetical protein [uncultured Metabacillus sp.]
MYLSKHPVISKEGNEYRVDVAEIEFGYIGVAIYKYVGLSKFRKREKFKVLYGGSIWDRHYDPSKYNYDYVKMAKTQVEHYEGLLKTEEKNTRAHSDGIEKFNSWNGKC